MNIFLDLVQWIHLRNASISAWRFSVYPMHKVSTAGGGWTWTCKPHLHGSQQFKLEWSETRSSKCFIAKLAESFFSYSCPSSRLACARRLSAQKNKNQFSEPPFLEDSKRKRCQKPSTIMFLYILLYNI